MQIEKLGPYRIGARLGRGGMGTVYAAEAVDTGMEAAVKVLSAPLAREEGFRERFKAEIESLRKLKHPNIVRLFGFGEEDSYLFYAMELVDGRSLEEEVQANRKFTWREVIPYSIMVCHALRHAHDRGVIHRDIKPANLLLNRDGIVKLSDFGIAKLFGHSSMTADGGVIGTAEYMAPEQADGRPVNHRCDLYSLGCVMYALCAGRPPFRARSLPEMLHMQRYAAPEPVRTFAPDVPIELEQTISELLVKDPEHRIPTALVLGRRLEAMAHGLVRRELQHPTTNAGKYANDEFELSSQGDIELTLAATDSDVGSTADPQDSLEYQISIEDVNDAITQIPGQEPSDQTAGSADQTRMPGNQNGGSDEQSITADADAVANRTVHRAGAQTATEPRPPAESRFTRVEDTDVLERRQHNNVISPQTMMLVVALLILGFGAWYVLQPVSAETLYQRIAQAAASDQMNDLVAVSPDIDRFMAQFPRDPRIPELRKYQAEIEMVRTQRRLQRKLRTDRVEEILSPIERAYAEAISIIERDPVRGLDKLEALIALFSDGQTRTDAEKQCLELARRQITKLTTAVEDMENRDLAEIKQQLNRADSLAPASPDEAVRIWRSLLELYGDKRWAQPSLEKARQAVAAESDSKAGSP